MIDWFDPRTFITKTTIYTESYMYTIYKFIYLNYFAPEFIIDCVDVIIDAAVMVNRNIKKSEILDYQPTVW